MGHEVGEVVWRSERSLQESRPVRGVGFDGLTGESKVLADLQLVVPLLGVELRGVAKPASPRDELVPRIGDRSLDLLPYRLRHAA